MSTPESRAFIRQEMFVMPCRFCGAGYMPQSFGVGYLVECRSRCLQSELLIKVCSSPALAIGHWSDQVKPQ